MIPPLDEDAGAPDVAVVIDQGNTVPDAPVGLPLDGAEPDTTEDASPADASTE